MASLHVRRLHLENGTANMKAKKNPSGVRHLLDYLGKHEGPKSKSDMKEEKDLLLKEYRAGQISFEEYQKKLEQLVME